jgi:hypothetical protein
MTADDDRTDPGLEALLRAAGHDATLARAGRIRQRCHRALARRADRGAGLRRALEPLLVGGICAIYLTEVLRRALQLYGR